MSTTTSFPDGFRWGTATAAHQVEGGNWNNDWWLWEHTEGTPCPEPSGDACDHYHRYREDIALLAEHFLETNATYGLKRLSPASMAALEAYSWPGNVRELLHVIERGVILSRGDEITPDDLPREVFGSHPPSAAAPTVSTAASLESMERQHILSTLRRVGGHRGKAAALLGIDPKTLYRKILGYNISSEEMTHSS
jgi:DNA-binding NtrC family response regulator